MPGSVEQPQRGPPRPRSRHARGAVIWDTPPLGVYRLRRTKDLRHAPPPPSGQDDRPLDCDPPCCAHPRQHRLSRRRRRRQGCPTPDAITGVKGVRGPETGRDHDQVADHWSLHRPLPDHDRPDAVRLARTRPRSGATARRSPCRAADRRSVTLTAAQTAAAGAGLGTVVASSSASRRERQRRRGLGGAALPLPEAHHDRRRGSTMTGTRLRYAAYNMHVQAEDIRAPVEGSAVPDRQEHRPGAPRRGRRRGAHAGDVDQQRRRDRAPGALRAGPAWATTSSPATTGYSRALPRTPGSSTTPPRCR